MTNENTQTENISEHIKESQSADVSISLVEETPKVENEAILELSDTREYPNQRDLMNHIVALYNQLNPPHKKLVRLTIARPSKE